MLTVGQLAERFNLSRTALLYYDSIGLLCPSARSRANYRLYSDEDVRRMELIGIYRRAGLPLADIGEILDSGSTALRNLLERRLEILGGEIDRLQQQQGLIVEILGGEAELPASRSLDKEGWVAVLRATGLDDDDMRRWHVEFERLSPEAHQEFLESLGIEAVEIAEIRRWSRSETAS